MTYNVIDLFLNMYALLFPAACFAKSGLLVWITEYQHNDLLIIFFFRKNTKY